MLMRPTLFISPSPRVPQSVCSKSSCVHPGRPVAQACGDCPRRARMMAMAKSK